MTGNGMLIARATARAYASAIAEGADAGSAFEAACALYRYGHPRTRECTLRRVVAALVHRPPIEARIPGRPAAVDRLADGPERDIVAAQNAYVAAISRGSAPHVAFDVARAAYRARQPGLSGERLDDAVARALATDAMRSTAARGAAEAVNPAPSPSARFRAGR
jgi:hypothetical protein